MWSFVLTTFNAVSSPSLLPELTRGLATEQITKNTFHPYHSTQENFEISQSLSLVESVSPGGYSLKHSSDWQKFNPQSSDPNFDIFLARNFPNAQGGFWVTITTTVVKYMGLPREVPENVRKIDISAEVYAMNLAESGYKIQEKADFLMNERKAIRLVTETPQNKGSIMIFIEGEDETMIVSTSVYPIDNSIISQDLLEQVVEEIELVQNSITIR